MDKIGIAEKAVYTLAMLCYGRFHVDRYRTYINNWKNANAKARQALQDRQFLKLLRYADHYVPFYRNLYRHAGVDIKAISGIRDIVKLPIVHKERLLNASANEKRPPVWKKPVSVRVSTSGSSGEPISFYRSAETLFINGAQLLTYLDHWGLRGKRKIYFLLHFADPTFCINLPQRSAYSIFNQSNAINPDLAIEKILRIIEGDKPDCLIAHPSKLEDLVDSWIEMNHMVDHAIVFATGGEMLTQRLKNKLKRVFPHHSIYDFYNTMEMGMIAYESPEHDGMHINDYAVVVEKGEKIYDVNGECYFNPIMTNLWNFSTPLIRYDGVDDLLQFSEDKSSFAYGKEAITSLHGRKSEKISDSRNNSISACVLMSAFADLTDVRRFQFVQSTPGEVCFRFIPSRTCNLDHVKEAVMGVFKRFFHDSMRVSLEKVDQIEKIGISRKYPILVGK